MMIPRGVRLKRQVMMISFAGLVAVIVVALLAFAAMYDYRYRRGAEGGWSCPRRTRFHGAGRSRRPCSTSEIRLQGLTWLVMRRAGTR